VAIPVVVAGLGPRGIDWVREVRRDPSFNLVGVADIQPDVLSRAGTGLGIPPPQRFPTLERALDHTSCQAVIVATSVGHHEQACRTAIERGLAVLVEKPFTIELQRARRLVQAAEERGVPLVVGQNFRYLRSWRTVRRVLADGVLGSLGMVSCHYYRPPHQMAASLAQLENAVLWGVAVHFLDALRYVLGQRITGVIAETFSGVHRQVPKGASMQALLAFDGGTRAVLTATYESSGHEFFEKGQEFYARFIGERATLHVFQRWLFLCEGRKFPRPIRRGMRPVAEERLLLGQLERALLQGEAPESSGRDNLQTMAAVEACLRSAAERRWINPQELLS
jgi:predicted dehydrogenase